MLKQHGFVLVGFCIYLFQLAYAQTPPKEINYTDLNLNSNAVVDKRLKKETIVEENPFAITFYKQNYVLPYYYTGSPYNKVYRDQIPTGEKIKKGELKFQLSLKAPIWKKILGSNSSLYFGYTQLSYWQAYNKNAFFRETDFQPEVFVLTPLNVPLISNWKLSAVSLGAVHESNGFGNELERSWNRIYIEAVTSTENFMLAVKPWYVVKDSTYKRFNADMAKYMGYGEVTFAYKIDRHVITLQARNIIESGGKRATGIASYSFPITKYINGFVQAFSGYGQSLIEYDHRTNSIGVGIAFSNLI